MHKPQHVDDKLYVIIVLWFFCFFLWHISYGSSSSSICPAFINVLDKKCIFF